MGGCSTHLVPVILLVGEHQEASVVNEDADEVLGKGNRVTLGGRRGTGASRPPTGPPLRPQPCPPPTLLLASQSISQLLEGSHCQPKWG